MISQKNAHLETCEEALIGCAFKEFGCNEKAPRKEMLEHEKDPHNGFLNQVILGLQERIENLERPLTALVKKLRNPDSEHREQCEKKKLACEYCKLELKGDDEKNAHLETCEEALIGCAFKEFGCNEKAPRKEMQEHEKDPHNALLNQVILGLQERIENLERPLTALVEKLRNSHSVGTSQ
ncbi:TNF receptor-associated factor 6-A-like [Ixodes scapularis]